MCSNVSDERTFAAAAGSGKMKMMVWLKQNECPWNAEMFKAAGVHDVIEIIEWLKKHECPWNTSLLLF